jgi:hypothetical protein
MEKKKITCPNCERALENVMVRSETVRYHWSDKDHLYQDPADVLDWIVLCPGCQWDLTSLLDKEPEGYVPTDPKKCKEPCEMAKEKGMDCCGECVELGVKIAHQEKPNV